MATFDVGMKIYDNDWYLKRRLSCDDAARLLRDWGVTFVLAKNRYLQMPDSAVKSEVTPELADLYAVYDDRKFRDALAKQGVGYWIAATMMFDPEALQADPTLRAIGSDGKPMEKIDWYIGVPPSMQRHVDNKVRNIETAVKLLEPDGIFLSFMRWPNFWELWMPDRARHDFPEYSFDAQTLRRFSDETGIALPSYEPVEAARWLETNRRQAWTDWKCGVVEGVVRQVKLMGRRYFPNMPVMLNTVPLGRDDYDNAEEKVFGQRFETLADVVDVFEVMTYHQILKRPVEWIPQIGRGSEAAFGTQDGLHVAGCAALRRRDAREGEPRAHAGGG